MLATATSTPAVPHRRKTLADYKGERCPECLASYAAFRAGGPTTAQAQASLEAHRLTDDGSASYSGASEIRSEEHARATRNAGCGMRLAGQVKRAAWEAAHGIGRCVADIPRVHGYGYTAADRADNLAALDFGDDDAPARDLACDDADLDDSFDPSAWGDDAPAEQPAAVDPGQVDEQPAVEADAPFPTPMIRISGRIFHATRRCPRRARSRAVCDAARAPRRWRRAGGRARARVRTWPGRRVGCADSPSLMQTWTPDFRATGDGRGIVTTMARKGPNMKHPGGRPINVEVREHIAAVAAANPAWSHLRIAREVGCAPRTVAKVVPPRIPATLERIPADLAAKAAAHGGVLAVLERALAEQVKPAPPLRDRWIPGERR